MVRREHSGVPCLDSLRAVSLKSVVGGGGGGGGGGGKEDNYKFNTPHPPVRNHI